MMERCNPGIDFEKCQSYFFERSVYVNTPSMHGSVECLSRTVREKNSQIALLLRAVTCLDLTTLCGDDTSSNVQRLCYKAAKPIDEEVLMKLDIDPAEIHCGAVCVYPSKVATCVKTLASLGVDIPVAAVACGFPSGQYHLKTRLDEIRCCVEDGAGEIDIVISRELVLCGEWGKLYAELKAMREACGGATLKTIIAAGELASLANVYKASLVCMAAGADYIKTSTGKESVNATLPIGIVMTRAIQDYKRETGYLVGFKPAGGIRTSKDVLLWQELMMRELDKRWLYSDLFRIGASSLLGDIEEKIIQFVNKDSSKPNLPFL